MTIETSNTPFESMWREIVDLVNRVAGSAERAAHTKPAPSHVASIELTKNLHELVFLLVRTRRSCDSQIADLEIQLDHIAASLQALGSAEEADLDRSRVAVRTAIVTSHRLRDAIIESHVQLSRAARHYAAQRSALESLAPSAPDLRDAVDRALNEIGEYESDVPSMLRRIGTASEVLSAIYARIGAPTDSRSYDRKGLLAWLDEGQEPVTDEARAAVVRSWEAD